MDASCFERVSRRHRRVLLALTAIAVAFASTVIYQGLHKPSLECVVMLCACVVSAVAAVCIAGYLDNRDWNR